MKETLLKKAWIFTDIEGVRDMEEMSTYYIFEYDKLPPVEINLDDEFNWLQPHIEYSSEGDWNYDFKNQLEILQEDAKSKGLVIPGNFIEFMSKAELLRKIRSNTDCYFELGDYIAEMPNGLYFLHFLSDSQYCRLWYLCLDKEGNSCVVTSYKVYGHNEDPHEDYEDEDDEDNEYSFDYFCSPTFKDFIYRFWLENEIWFKIYEKEQLNEVEQRYVRHYLDNKG